MFLCSENSRLCIFSTLALLYWRNILLTSSYFSLFLLLVSFISLSKCLALHLRQIERNKLGYSFSRSLFLVAYFIHGNLCQNGDKNIISVGPSDSLFITERSLTLKWETSTNFYIEETKKRKRNLKKTLPLQEHDSSSKSSRTIIIMCRCLRKNVLIFLKIFKITDH